MEATTAVPRKYPPPRSPSNLGRLGYWVEDTVRPLIALVERLSPDAIPDDYLPLEQTDRAEDVARFAAKELQDMIRDEGSEAFPGNVENELYRIEATVAALNCMAVVIHQGGFEGSRVKLPEDGERWTYLPTRYEVIESMRLLARELEALVDGLPRRWAAAAKEQEQEATS